jgi:hypothetical protein
MQAHCLEVECARRLLIAGQQASAPILNDGGLGEAGVISPHSFPKESGRRFSGRGLNQSPELDRRTFDGANLLGAPGKFVVIFCRPLHRFLCLTALKLVGFGPEFLGPISKITGRLLTLDAHLVTPPDQEETWSTAIVVQFGRTEVAACVDSENQWMRRTCRIRLRRCCGSGGRAWRGRGPQSIGACYADRTARRAPLQLKADLRWCLSLNERSA